MRDEKTAGGGQVAEEIAFLEERVADLEARLAHAHRLATLGTLTATVAHEYNNILTPLLSYAQIAMSEPSDSDLGRKAIAKVIQCGERAAEVSSSLAGFARGAGPDPREARAVPRARLREVVDESLACLGRDPARDGVEVSIAVPDVALAIRPTQLQQVLVNLMLNAVRAMRPRGGQLKISAQAEGVGFQVTVADTGPGVPDSIRDRVFEPFVTALSPEVPPEVPPEADPESAPESTRKTSPAFPLPEASKAAGTGLGLSICRDLVVAVGGRIELVSPPGSGAVFHVYLPGAQTGRAAA